MLSLPFPSLRTCLLIGCPIWVLAVLIFAMCSLRAQAPTGGTAAVSAKNGDAIFHQRCIVCHNKQRDDDSPFGPPNLYTAFHGKAALTPRAAALIVTKGRGTMPAFGTTLSRTEILSVIAYLRSR